MEVASSAQPEWLGGKGCCCLPRTTSLGGFILAPSALLSMPAAVASAVKESAASRARTTICAGSPSASALEVQKSARRRFALITMLRSCTKWQWALESVANARRARRCVGRPHLGFSDAAVPKDEDPQQDPRGVHELLVLPVARLAWPAHVDWSVPRIIIVVGRAMSAASQGRATFLAGQADMG
jgi:hypothetical protein